MDTKSIGEVIKNARLKKKILQKELADMLGVTQLTIGRWEREESIPSIVNQRKIEKILEVEI